MKGAQEELHIGEHEKVVALSLIHIYQVNDRPSAGSGGRN